jgi:hypothetical protein
LLFSLFCSFLNAFSRRAASQRLYSLEISRALWFAIFPG